MRKHRGLAPEDTLFFDPKRLAVLRQAVGDLSWLLQRGYSTKAALVLVGNHFQLVERERLAIVHTAGDGAPRRTPLAFEELRGKALCIDGFNLLITLETALGGGIILVGTDGCYRDIANIHGSYALRAETEEAITVAATALKEAGVAKALWLFDRPVSNSGRVAALVNDTASRLAVPMEARTADEVDAKVKRCGGVAVTADSEILASRVAWFDLAGWIIQKQIADARLIDLRSSPDA
ncbi:DUF434 domain-containing protein [Sulfurimonas diazotrophicus]|uniref:DUF434 domain-containing protein n=1 Tax=Sulfurimonas diazotrophicus TaxID=3131939 RepID=A0ABZ3HA57_9BACT